MLSWARAARSAERDADLTMASPVPTVACTLSTIYERPMNGVKERERSMAGAFVWRWTEE